jgi:hypothetical protein
VSRLACWMMRPGDAGWRSCFAAAAAEARPSARTGALARDLGWRLSSAREAIGDSAEA